MLFEIARSRASCLSSNSNAVDYFPRFSFTSGSMASHNLLTP
jgi:hypothetical protein